MRIYMGILTEREKTIIELLREGKSVKEIGKKLGISDTSVSRSIKNVRLKVLDLEDDIHFFIEVGFLSIEGGKLEFISRSKDPKALAKFAKK